MMNGTKLKTRSSQGTLKKETTILLPHSWRDLNISFAGNVSSSGQSGVTECHLIKAEGNLSAG
jgi:hypothetical protein